MRLSALPPALSRLAVLLLLAGFVAACGGSKETASLTPEPNEETIEAAPDWYLAPPRDDNYVLAAATATSRDMQLAIDKAQTTARGEIAATLEAKFSGLVKQFQEEVGTDNSAELLEQYTQTYKTVVSQVMVGSNARQRSVDVDRGVYRAYVLMELPVGEAARQLMQRIQSNQAMYTRFRSTQAFEEMEREVEAYEQWKREQQRGMADDSDE
jgi:hypothetical protein